MKRSTYIMFALIIAGVLLGASFFSFIRIAGEECDDTYRRGPEMISAEVSRLDLNQFSRLDINYSCKDEEENNYSIYVIGGVHVVISTDSTTTLPYALVPETMTGNVIMDDHMGELILDIAFSNRFCEFVDSLSSPISICIPAGMQLTEVKCRNSVDTHLITENLDMNDIYFELDNDVRLYLNYGMFGNVTVSGNDYVNVFDTKIKTLSIDGFDETGVIYANGTVVGETILRGSSVDYELNGVADFRAMPDSTGTITVRQTYGN